MMENTENKATVGRVVGVEQALMQRKRMKVMVAIDESDGSFYALKWALDHLFVSSIGSGAGVAPEEASQDEVDMVILVHVQQHFHYYTAVAGPGGTGLYSARFGRPMYTSTALMESVRKAEQEKSAILLSRALHICKEKMIKAESMILDGDAKEKICEATEQVHVDLLVVGSRGLGMVKRAFIGSVSDYCAHHATCPILIVKPQKGRLSVRVINNH